MTNAILVRKPRVSAPKKTRAELAAEFSATPLNAYVSTALVAAYLCCSEALLERNRWSGDGLPYLKTGRLVRYRKSDVVAHIERQTRANTSAGGPK
jgi:hypothetical protein